MAEDARDEQPDFVPIERGRQRESWRGKPIKSLDELRADLWDSDEEVERFIAQVRE